MSSYHQRTTPLIADKARQLQAANIGRSFDLSDAEDALAFAEWFVDTADLLGMTLVPNWPSLTEVDRELIDYTREELQAIAQFARDWRNYR